MCKINHQFKRSPVFRQRRTWTAAIVLLGLLIGLLASVRFTHSSKHRGWATLNGISYVNALTVDPQGWVWVAHKGREITGFDPDSGGTVSIPPDTRLTGEIVTALVCDNQGGLWLGTQSGAVHLRNANGEWITYSPEQPQRYNQVWKLALDGQGRVWVATWNGLGLIEPQDDATTYSSESSGLGRGTFNGVTTDRQGQVWVLSNHRLMLLDAQGNWATHAETDGTRLAIDTQGRPWVGIYEGVAVLDHAGTWTAYNLRERGDPKLGLNIVDIVPDARGRVWVASEPQGLFMFDPDTGWTNHNASNSGLPDDWVTALTTDGQARVWAGTQSGLSVLDPGATLPPQDIQRALTVHTVVIPVGVLGIAIAALVIIGFTSTGKLWSKILRDSLIGFSGWFVLTIVVIIMGEVVLTVIAAPLGEQAICLLPVFCAMPLLHLSGVVFLAITRRWIALGALVAIIANLIVRLLVAPGFFDTFILMLPFFLSFSEY